MPGSHSVERYVIEENLHCIIKTHWKERKTWWVATSLRVHLIQMFKGLQLCIILTFQRSTVTQLSREKQDPTQLPHCGGTVLVAIQINRYYVLTACRKSQIELYFVQVIFGQLFQLPIPPHIDVMYTALLIELCKLQPGSLPQVVSFTVCVSGK